MSSNIERLAEEAMAADLDLRREADELDNAVKEQKEKLADAYIKTMTMPSAPDALVKMVQENIERLDTNSDKPVDNFLIAKTLRLIDGKLTELDLKNNIANALEVFDQLKQEGRLNFIVTIERADFLIDTTRSIVAELGIEIAIKDADIHDIDDYFNILEKLRERIFAEYDIPLSEQGDEDDEDF